MLGAGTAGGYTPDFVLDTRFWMGHCSNQKSFDFTYYLVIPLYILNRVPYSNNQYMNLVPYFWFREADWVPSVTRWK